MKLIRYATLGKRLPQGLKQRLLPVWNTALSIEQRHYEYLLYREFISRGDLVFDIGANWGHKTDAFLRLGARVLAIEPNPSCVSRLQKRFSRAIARGQLTILPAAVGRTAGRTRLTQFWADGANSTCSRTFASLLEQQMGPPTATYEVEVVPGGELFKRYGLPRFAKIDVEGMDAEVLSTFRIAPRILSFEYNLAPQVLSMTTACFEQVTRLGYSKGNFTQASDTTLVSRSWIPLAELLDELMQASCAGTTSWGDVFVC